MKRTILLLALIWPSADSPAGFTPAPGKEQIFLHCSGWQKWGDEQLVVDPVNNKITRLRGSAAIAYRITTLNDHSIKATADPHFGDIWAYDDKAPSLDELKKMFVNLSINRLTGTATYRLLKPMDIPAGSAQIIGKMVWTCKKMERAF